MQPVLEDVFMALHQKVGTSLRQEAKSLDYTISQLEVLRFVIAEQHPTMKDIATHLHITAPSATSLIEHLCDHKLVTRKTDLLDRREVRVHPTSKTVRLFSKFKNLKNTVFSELLRPLSTTDREHLTTILSKLI